MNSIYNLQREERIKELFKNILSKNKNLIQISSLSTDFINENELFEIVEIIESKTHYIADSPSFEFDGRSLHSHTFRCSSKDEVKSYMNSHPVDFFIVYNIISNTQVYTNTYVNGQAQQNSYDIRGVFVKDPSAIRDKIIDEILDKK